MMFAYDVCLDSVTLALKTSDRLYLRRNAVPKAKDAVTASTASREAVFAALLAAGFAEESNCGALPGGRVSWFLLSDC